MADWSDVDRERLYEAAAYFMSILGATVLGASIGLGFGSYLTHQRFRCGFFASNVSSESFVNMSDACGDVLEATDTMVIAFALSGTVAFMCGLAVTVYIKRGGLDG